ncbi:hypothetical protein QA811_02035 [Streptomyces sp. B21-102]|uniref:hypothetical protein n=1 Tax=Streptomyces sp. B21-102 TaxID=3039416 RepID=UPI002FF29A3C
MTNKQQQIEDYTKGAAHCRDMQIHMAAAGDRDAARGYGEAMDANLDRVNELKAGH